MNGAAELWKLAFGDSDEFINNYLDFAAAGDCFYALQVNGKVVSFLNLIPLSYSLNGKSFKGLYLFGVATDPAFRGEGFSRKLLRDSLTGCEADFVVTVPASESLFGFYGLQGFTTVVSRSYETIRSGDKYPDRKTMLHWLPADFSQLCSLYRATSGDRFQWTDNYLHLIADEYEWMLFRIDDTDYFCIFQIADKQITIQDSNAPVEWLLLAFREKGYTDSEIRMATFGDDRSGEPFYAVSFLNDALKDIFTGRSVLNMAMDS